MLITNVGSCTHYNTMQFIHSFKAAHFIVVTNKIPLSRVIANAVVKAALVAALLACLHH